MNKPFETHRSHREQEGGGAVSATGPEAPLPVLTPPAEKREPTKPTVATSHPAPSTIQSQDEFSQNLALLDRVATRYGLGTIDPATKQFVPTDWIAQAQRALGSGPEKPPDPEQAYRNPWVQAAILAPAAVGAFTGGGLRGFAGSAAALGGLLGGQAQRKLLYEQGLGAYQDRLARTAGQLEQQGTRVFQAVAPWLLNKADAELHAKLVLLHEQSVQDANAIRQQQFAWQNDNTVMALQLKAGWQANMFAQKQIEDAMLAKYREAQEAFMGARMTQGEEALGLRREYQSQYLGVLRDRLKLAQQVANDPAKDINALGGAIRSVQYMLAVLQSGGAQEAFPGEMDYIQRTLLGMMGTQQSWIAEEEKRRQLQSPPSPPPPPPPPGAPPPPPAGAAPAQGAPISAPPPTPPGLPAGSSAGWDRNGKRWVWKLPDGTYADEKGNPTQ